MNTMSIFISYLVRNINQVINNMKDEESAKNVYGEFNQKDQRIAELEKENEELKQQLAEQIKTVNIERRINNGFYKRN